MDFIEEHPKISLVEYLTSRQIDLLAENFDVASALTRARSPIRHW